MRRYVVVFEKGSNNWSAFSPDVPGCVTTGRSKEETARNMQEALSLHLEALRDSGLPVPEGSAPDTEATILDVA
jgi:predicted RNase H-like HicB family nuclease